MKAFTRSVMCLVMLAIVAGAFGSASSAFAGKKDSKKPSVSSCAVEFSKAFPEAVKKAQKNGGTFIIPVVTGTFEGYVYYTKKDKRGKSHDYYYYVKCGKISGPYND